MKKPRESIDVPKPQSIGPGKRWNGSGVTWDASCVGKDGIGAP